MESILVGVDHSENSRRAAQFAIECLAHPGSTVTIAHIIYWSKFAFPTVTQNETRPREVTRLKEKAASEVVDPILRWADENGHLERLTVDSLIRFGRPSEALSDVARSVSADTLVVARTGESHLRNAIFGSTVNRLVQHAPIPVVVVP